MEVVFESRGYRAVVYRGRRRCVVGSMHLLGRIIQPSGGRGKRGVEASGEVEDFDFVVFEAALGEVVLYIVDYFGEDFVGVTGVGANAGYAYGGALPVIVIGNFGSGDVVLVDDSCEDRFEVLPLVFEGVVFRQV
jgi:hypothetical protein